MNIRKNEPKETTLSTIGHVYEGVGGKALEAFLLAVCPGLAPAALITGLFSHAKTMRGQLKLDHFLAKVTEALEQHRNEIDSISENIEEVFELARQGITTSATNDKIQRFANIVSGHIIRDPDWDRTTTALRILTDLEDIHIRILSVASLYATQNDLGSFYILDPDSHAAKEARRKLQQQTDPILTSGGPGIGLAMGGQKKPKNILEDIGNLLPVDANLFCMQLMSKGLLHDNDQGYNTDGSVYTLTNGAYWFLSTVEYISKEGSTHVNGD